MGKGYYVGLDMGTGSVGWAVTDESYQILRRHGKAGEISCEPEIKAEVTVFKEKVDETIEVVKKVHPYEEPVINVIPIWRTSF